MVTAEQKARLDEAVWVSPQRMVQSLIDFLEGGETIDQFLALYPGITRQQVVAVLDFANHQILECASLLMSA